MTQDEQTRREVRAWLEELQVCVRNVDFERARPLFDDDLYSFGSKASAVDGLDALEEEQWRHVWPNIEAFAFDFDSLVIEGHGDMAAAIVPWKSKGFAPDGEKFERPGRATVVLRHGPDGWRAQHTHFSLVPGVPNTHKRS